MRRRKFLGVLGGAVVAGPFAARAQQAMPVIGYFNSGMPAAQSDNIAAFRRGLGEGGFVEGRNVAIEFHWGLNQFSGLPALATEVVQRRPDVIVSNTLAALRAKAVTATIPIVFTTGSDPVRDGLVASLSRPGGNVTGVVFITGELGAKRLELLRQLVPKAKTIAFLIYPNTPVTEAELKDVLTAAQATGASLTVFDVRNAREIEAAFAAFSKRRIDALLIGTGPFTFNNRKLIVALASRHAIPAMSALRDYATAGGLMSYGTSITDAFRQAGLYTGRVLKGDKPADLPVMQSTKFELVINTKTAKTLGLTVPDKLIALADELIE